MLPGDGTRIFARRFLTVCLWVGLGVVAAATPAAAEFGYAGGSDPAVSINPETGEISAVLPALSQSESRDCLLSISHLRDGLPASDVGLFRAAVMNGANLAIYLESLGNVSPGDQIAFELIDCSDVEPELQTSSTIVTANAKYVPLAADSSHAAAVAVPALVLATLIVSLFAVRRVTTSRLN